MSKNKKSKQEKVSKATASNKKAVDAVKKGKAKNVAEPAPERHLIVVSEYAVEGEKPQWGAQLDALREADITAGMTPKAARVQRASRVRKLKRGETLPDHGGLFDLDAVQGEPQQPEVEIVEPTSPAPDQQALLDLEADGEIVLSGDLTKKQRKALAKMQAKEAEVAAARQQAEIAEREAAEAAELARRNGETAKKGKKSKHQEVAEAEVEANIPEPYNGEEPPRVAEPEQAPTRTRTDMIRKALEEAIIRRDQTGEMQVIELPRQYKVKNYHASLIRKYGPDFEGLAGSERFDDATELFNITLTLPSIKVTRNDAPAKKSKKNKK